jgi:DNA polymerase-3 subunit alpha
VLSGGLNGEISSKILNEGEEKAEECLKWWIDNFNWKLCS